MAVYVCSLIVTEAQSIPADGGYHLLRFPYGSGESYDPHNMHPASQPDGEESSYPDERSALIWPTVEGWGSLTAMIHWDAGDHSEVRSQYIRDPLDLADGPDTTCTEDHSGTPGKEFRAKHHEMLVYPGTPLAVRVRHNGSGASDVILAEFKLAIHSDVREP